MFLFPGAEKRPDNLGIQNGQLAPCPDIPNCVSSFATNRDNSIAPLSYTGTTENARTVLLKVLKNYGGISIIQQTATYIYAECKILLFIDDLEFYFLPEQGIIHVRSASRVGKGDFGVNRRRVERIRKAFQVKL